MNNAKVIKLKKVLKTKQRISKGVNVLNWCIPVTVNKNGKRGGAVRIPNRFLERLGWKPGQTQVEVAITEDGNKLVIEKFAKQPQEKAS